MRGQIEVGKEYMQMEEMGGCLITRPYISQDPMFGVHDLAHLSPNVYGGGGSTLFDDGALLPIKNRSSWWICQRTTIFFLIFAPF